MTTLHDRLTALADDVPVGPAEPDLWERGRQLHRKRRLGTAVIVAACCLALLGVGFLDWQQRRAPVQPASGDGQVGIPGRFHEPSPWLPGTDGEPFDRLIALLPAERNSFSGSEPGWVGVSATTGEYRFLDLPDAAPQPFIGLISPTAPALSPDGRRVAYWLSEDRLPEPTGGDNVVSGFAVYDLTTGQSDYYDDTDALAPEVLSWLGNDRLVVSTRRIHVEDDAVSEERALRKIWDLEAKEATPWDGHVVDSAGGGWLVERPDKRRRLRNVDDPARIIRFRGDVTMLSAWVSPNERRVVGITDTVRDGDTLTAGLNWLAVTELSSTADQVEFALLAGPDSPQGRISGWADNHTVVLQVAGDPTDDPSFEGFGLMAVDVRTGDERLLSVLDRDTLFASELLDAPVVERPAPPEPSSPWTKVWSAIAIVTLGGAVLLIWRRRVRP